MRIGFDAKRLFNNFTGLGNYSRFVVNALLDHAPGNELVLYTPKIKTHADIDAIISREHVEVVTPPSVYKFTGTSSLWRSWGMSREPSAHSLSVFHGLSQELPFSLPKHIRKIVTVHDLIFLLFPELYKPVDAGIYKLKVSKACDMADQIIAISQQTADDLVSFLGVPKAKIKVVYQGCHRQFAQRVPAIHIEQIRQKYQLPPKYLLNVGTLERRKNALVAVKALSIIKDSVRLPLVMVGRETAYKQEILAEATKLGIADRLIFLHNIPFDELPALYQGASIFIYPSLFEGFGIPIVEAMESNVPVISSRGSCFEEAGGPDTIYVDPVRPEELAMQMMDVLSDEILRQRMIDGGKSYVKRFSPARIAADLLKVYAANT